MNYKGLHLNNPQEKKMVIEKARRKLGEKNNSNSDWISRDSGTKTKLVPYGKHSLPSNSSYHDVPHFAGNPWKADIQRLSNFIEKMKERMARKVNSKRVVLSVKKTNGNTCVVIFSLNVIDSFPYKRGLFH